MDDGQMKAAADEMRARIRNALPGVEPIRTGGEWADGFLDRSLFAPDARRCRHLHDRPAQPAYCFAWERLWRCAACNSARVAEAKKQMDAGTYTGLGRVEEGTCDHCRTHVGASSLTPFVLQGGMRAAWGSVCGRCSAAMKHDKRDELAKLGHPVPEVVADGDTRYAAKLTEFGGERAVMLAEQVPATGSPELRAALGRRKRANETGTCDCGAAVILPNRAERRRAQRTGEVLHARMEHEDDCTAGDDAIRRLHRAAMS